DSNGRAVLNEQPTKFYRAKKSRFTRPRSCWDKRCLKNRNKRNRPAQISANWNAESVAILRFFEWLETVEKRAKQVLLDFEDRRVRTQRTAAGWSKVTI